MPGFAARATGANVLTTPLEADV